MRLNKVLVVGNLGRDASTATTANGSFRAFFTIASNRRYKDNNGEWVEEVTWIPCSWWGKGAEAVAKHLTKGKQVFIEGRLRSYKSKDQDGVERERLEVRVDSLELGDRATDDRNEKTNDGFDFDDDTKEDVPF